ncbi:MAG: copper resistance protein CopC [Chloroflexi bacterium]|nr:copper resistance protein CopC [Chloroflexota bacterium]
MRRLFFAAPAAIAALVVVTAVFAHAEPATVFPGDGAVLAAAPRSIMMTMTQELARQQGANDIDVVDAKGVEVTTEAAVISDTNRRLLSVNLPTSLPAGDYTVRWKTLSAEDGDGATGQTTFRIDPNAIPSPGKEVLKASVLGETPTPAPGLADFAEGGGGTSWVLVTAVGLAALVAGAGAMYLLGPRRA